MLHNISKPARYDMKANSNWSTALCINGVLPGTGICYVFETLALLSVS